MSSLHDALCGSHNKPLDLEDGSSDLLHAIGTRVFGRGFLHLYLLAHNGLGVLSVEAASMTSLHVHHLEVGSDIAIIEGEHAAGHSARTIICARDAVVVLRLSQSCLQIDLQLLERLMGSESLVIVVDPGRHHIKADRQRIEDLKTKTGFMFLRDESGLEEHATLLKIYEAIALA